MRNDSTLSESHALTGDNVTTARIEAMLAGNVTVSEQARERVVASRALLEERVAAGDIIYGVNTGFGALATTQLEPDDLDAHQVRLVRSHAVGVGPWINAETSRLMLLLRLNSFLRGRSGVRPELIDHMVTCFNAGMVPAIASYGSVGASGDLSPLAQLAMALIGEGQVFDDDAIRPAKAWLSDHGIEPLKLTMKEGLSLINGTCFMNAWGMIAVRRLERMLDWSFAVGLLSAEAMLVHRDAFHPLLSEARHSQSQAKIARLLYDQLGHSDLTSATDTHPHRSPQDAYSLRCMPQVWGAIHEHLVHATMVLDQEANAVTDNPLIFVETGDIISGGNFHGERVALALTQLKLVAAELGNFAERRLAKLLDPATNHGLPPFLAADPGRNSGFMIAQYSAAERVAESRVLSSPGSVDSVPTSANVEDHVSMGPVEARTLWWIQTNTIMILAAEALSAAQAADFRLKMVGLTPESLSPMARQAYDAVRRIMPFSAEDEDLSGPIQAMIDHLETTPFAEGPLILRDDR